MAHDKMTDKFTETDLLVIGGGIAGCCIAAKAAETGLSVTILEKSHTRRSGNAGQGIDHYESVPRGSVTPKLLTEKFQSEMTRINGGGRFGNPNLLYQYFASQWDTIEELEKLGVPMKWDDGDYYFFNRPDMFPGERYWLRVHWQMIKPILSKAVRDRGVNVFERVMATELLKDKGRIAGATAMNTRTGEFLVIKAKAVVMATGIFQRCYDGESPMSGPYKLRYDGCPASLSGDGYAMAYRAGADLVNMDANGWMFRCRDDLCISFGNFEHNDGLPSTYFTWDGEEFPFADALVYRKMEESGKAPLYRWLKHMPKDYNKRGELCFVDEKMVDFKFAEDRRFNPQSHAYEVTPFKPLSFMASTGVHIDENYSSRIPGLFAIGDAASPLHSCSVAAGSAFLLAKKLPEYLKTVPDLVIDIDQVESAREIIFSPMETEKPDTEPLELESAVRFICERYVGILKSEGKLKEGLRRLGSLRRLVLHRVNAKNPHQIMRYLEARNVLDLAEVHINSCLLRKESRGNFIRLDYPDLDSSRDSILTHLRMEDGKAVNELVMVPEMKPEYMKED